MATVEHGQVITRYAGTKPRLASASPTTAGVAMALGVTDDDELEAFVERAKIGRP
jgi:hypothetical protein